MRDPRNAVLIGLGMVADMHAQAIAGSQSGVRLHGVLARRTDQAQRFARAHDTRAYDTLDDVIADPEVGFAILATPPDARAAFIGPLAEAGIAILTEKPLERDAARARALVTQCEAAGVPLGVVLQHRMRPAAQVLLDRVNTGALGPIATVELRVPWWRDQSYYDAPGRGTYARDGGGVLITQAIHALDLMLQLCGPVAQVQAMTLSSPLHQLEAEDFAGAALRFASGAVGTVMASTTHYPGGAEDIVLNGTLASAQLSAAQLTLSYRDGRVETHEGAAQSGGGADPMAFTSAWHRAVIDDFSQALAEARPPAIPGRSALSAQVLIDAIATSSRTGTRVDLGECDD